MVVCEETHTFFFFFFNQFTWSPLLVLWAGLIQPSSPVPSAPYCLFPIESLLRGASLEFHGPWGFPVLFTVMGNQVTQPGPLYLDPYWDTVDPTPGIIAGKKKKAEFKNRINTRFLDGKEWGQYSGSHNPKNKKQDHLSYFLATSLNL